MEKSKECQYGWKVPGKVGGAASASVHVSSKRMFEDADLVVVVVCWEM